MLGMVQRRREEEIEERRRKVKEEDQPIVQAVRSHLDACSWPRYPWRSARLVRSLTIFVAGSPPSCHLLPFWFFELAPSRGRRPQLRRTSK